MAQKIKTEDMIAETRRQRGIPTLPDETAQRLGNIHGAYSQGYQTAITTEALDTIIPKLNVVAPDLLGFALEGAGTGLAQKDMLESGKESRLEAFANGPAAVYENFVYVGLGLILGKKRLPIEPYLNSLNLIRSWLVLDGYGFQHGFTHWQEYLQGQPIPETISGYGCEVFDQGMGRSIWFIDGADVTRVKQTISLFPLERQINLWSGVAYACAYAGGVSLSTLEALSTAAGPYRSILQKTASVAAKSRQLTANPSVYTELACQVLCGMSAEAAAKSVDSLLKNLPINLADQEDWQPYRVHIMNLRIRGLVTMSENKATDR